LRRPRVRPSPFVPASLGGDFTGTSCFRAVFDAGGAGCRAAPLLPLLGGRSRRLQGAGARAEPCPRRQHKHRGNPARPLGALAPGVPLPQSPRRPRQSEQVQPRHPRQSSQSFQYASTRACRGPTPRLSRWTNRSSRPARGGPWWLLLALPPVGELGVGVHGNTSSEPRRGWWAPVVGCFSLRVRRGPCEAALRAGRVGVSRVWEAPSSGPKSVPCRVASRTPSRTDSRTAAASNVSRAKEVRDRTTRFDERTQGGILAEPASPPAYLCQSPTASFSSVSLIAPDAVTSTRARSPPRPTAIRRPPADRLPHALTPPERHAPARAAGVEGGAGDTDDASPGRPRTSRSRSH